MANITCYYIFVYFYALGPWFLVNLEVYYQRVLIIFGNDL